MSRTPRMKAFARPATALVTVLLLSACATTQDVATRSDGINDPYETQNRKVHGFNKGLDKNIVRPVSQAYGVVPVEIRNTVNNFSDNLSMPGVAVNSLLQGDLRGTGLATLRFVMNTTIGLGGLFDAASELNIPEHQTDFGETLTVWGSGEGAYIELPVFGPSTQRDTVGLVVDFFTNPLTYNTIDGDARAVPPTAAAASVLNDREKFSDTIDSVLYESADSYSQSRSIYLQNRRFELGQGQGTDIDPFATDPYEDPYAQ
ncbi:VacJ family lipoprotein [uncultured Roseobacter sp.]|uniref:MlaA family lipoprotein n=1 Tax=uncultured Roseobacter sp. TaxID=114847 RepID=UPI0026272671|nr:VacJ family lipoprotein [uncultured Roseobacter sp.]